MTVSRPTLLVFVVSILTAFSGKVQAQDKTLSRGRPVVAPGVKFVEPQTRVALVCSRCGGAISQAPEGFLRLGTTLKRAGFEVTLTKDKPREGFAAVVVEGRGEKGVIGFSGIEVERVLADVERLVCGEPSQSKPQRYLFIVGENSGFERSLFLHISWVVYYARLDADFVTVESLQKAPRCWLRRYTAVAIAVETLRGFLQPKEVLEDFVVHGGRVVWLMWPGDESVLPIFGITRAAREETVEEVRCERGFLPGGGELALRYGPEWGLKVRAVEIDERTKVLCRAKTSSGLEVPSVIVRETDYGAALLWLTGDLASKSSRGRILLALLEVSKPSAAAIMDALVFYVDDCPMPMTGDKLPPLDTLYGMTDSEFYLQKWWPDLKGLFQRFDIRPTFAFVASYDARVEPPFVSHFQAAAGENGGVLGSTTLAKNIAAEGYEIALHGYNHQSLTVAQDERSKGWPGLEAMVEALSVARATMTYLFGDAALPRVYVAPNNLVHTLGKQAVKKVFPEVVAIASQYLDEDNILGQEFASDPDIPTLVNIPRLSSEGFMDSENAGEILDGLICPGVFSHFIHPDDILDRERSRGLDWEGLRAGLERLLAFVRQQWPFLRAMGASEFAGLVQAWPQARLEVTRGSNSLVLRASSAPRGLLTVFVRIPYGRYGEVAGPCETVFEIPSEGRLYVRVGERPCTVHWQ